MKKVCLCAIVLILFTGIFVMQPVNANAAPTPTPSAQGKSVEEQLYEYYTVLAQQERAKGNTKAASEAAKKAEEYAAIVNAQKNGNFKPGAIATPRKSVLDVATSYYEMGNGWSSSLDGMTFKHNKTGEIYYSYKGLTTDYPDFGKFLYTGDTCKVMVCACCERLKRYGILTYENACEKMKAEGYSLRSADKRALIQWVDPNVTQVRFTHNAMICVFERDYSLTPYATPADYYNNSYLYTPTPSATPYDYYERTDATPTPTATVTPVYTPTATPYSVQDAERYRVD